MTRVLVIGAAGVFGGYLAKGLLDSGFEVVVAGRDADRTAAKARQLQANHPGASVSTAVLDTRTLTPEDLKATGAAIIADAAGPFQAASPTVALAAIEAGLHYVDLADGRAFVADFPRLDPAARARGVTALTGCSSTPALSNAVIDVLTDGWREIATLEVAISPGARAPRGLSVMQAILSWIGKPVRLFEGGEWRLRQGWSGLFRRDFGKAGVRRVSLCETPDLDILIERHHPTTSGRMLAGLEPWPMHLGAWALARAGGALGVDMRAWARPLITLSSGMSACGSDRGAMRVEAVGTDGRGRATRAVWLLTAEPGAGPVTPSLPALIATKAIAAGALSPGAGACVGCLPLSALEAEIERHPIGVEILVRRTTLFHRALGDAFDALPPAICRLHETCGHSTWRGRAQTWGAASPLGAIVARCVGFPGACADGPVEVQIDADGRRSIWRRLIGSGVFLSVLSRPREGGRVRERFGLISFDLELAPAGDRLTYSVTGWRIGPLPMPRGFAPSTRAHEEVDDQGRFVFDVEIIAPLVGRLVRYRGWLERVEPVPPPK